MTEREPIARVSCTQCINFIPDAVGNSVGLGQCKKYEEYKAKGANDVQLHNAFVRLGNKQFWAGTDSKNDRFCLKFEGKYSFPVGK